MTTCLNGFKRRTAAVLKSNSIKSIEFGHGSSTTFETGLMRMGYGHQLQHAVYIIWLKIPGCSGVGSTAVES